MTCDDHLIFEAITYPFKSDYFIATSHGSTIEMSTYKLLIRAKLVTPEYGALQRYLKCVPKIGFYKHEYSLDHSLIIITYDLINLNYLSDNPRLIHYILQTVENEIEKAKQIIAVLNNKDKLNLDI